MQESSPRQPDVDKHSISSCVPSGDVCYVMAGEQCLLAEIHQGAILEECERSFTQTCYILYFSHHICAGIRQYVLNQCCMASSFGQEFSIKFTQ